LNDPKGIAAAALVGMMLFGFVSVGFLYLESKSGLLDAQNGIVILHIVLVSLGPQVEL
jgi:ribose/xylose/arabinose/galactoside ABC-type transport system permease subunit